MGVGVKIFLCSKRGGVKKQLKKKLALAVLSLGYVAQRIVIKKRHKSSF